MLTLCLAATYTEGEWWVTIASPIVAGSAQCEELRKLLQLHAETLKIYAIPWDARHANSSVFLWRCKLLSDSAVWR